ncbi:MAG: hypothetical protein U0989_13360, partial [Azonexus sp.]|nr:hypothetical protein [Azonexus sp.]
MAQAERRKCVHCGASFTPEARNMRIPAVTGNSPAFLPMSEEYARAIATDCLRRVASIIAASVPLHDWLDAVQH